MTNFCPKTLNLYIGKNVRIYLYEYCFLLFSDICEGFLGLKVIVELFMCEC